MAQGTDIAFVVRVEPRGDAGDPSIYQPLRMEIEGHEANLPFLRRHVGNERSLGLSRRVEELTRYFGGAPVLTPYLLKDYFEARDVSFEVIPCLTSGWERLRGLGASGVKVVALSTTWARAVDAPRGFREAARRIKRELPGAVVVAGGIGVQKGIHSRRLSEQGSLAVPEEALSEMFLGVDAEKDKDFDALVHGANSEGTLLRIVEHVRAGKDFRALPNLAVPRDGAYQINETAEVDGAIRDTVVDWRKYYREIFPLWTPVFSSVGCPFQCEFCDFFPLFKCKLRDESKLIDELKTLKGTPPPRFVFFSDDNFGINRNRLSSVLKAMIREKLGIKWFAFLRADIIDREIAALLREAGCHELLLGIESGDAGILSNMNKRLDLEVASRAVAHLDGVGIRTNCTFVVGFPGETQRSIENTVQWISSMPGGPSARAYHRYYLFRFLVVPLSPISQRAQREKHGLRGLQEDWSHNTMCAEEAKQAMKDMFLRITGPTHYYVEPPQFDWPAAVTREIMELRENAQKMLCREDARGSVLRDDLLQKVRAANAKYALSPLKRLGLKLYYRSKGISF